MDRTNTRMSVGFLLTCLLRDMTELAILSGNISLFLLTCLLRDMTNFIFNSRIPSEFLLTCLLRDMTTEKELDAYNFYVSTHMPLARHDADDQEHWFSCTVSTHMPLARHDAMYGMCVTAILRFYSHASCET